MTTQKLPQHTAAGGIRYLKGFGPKRAAALEKLGIFTLRDLLYFFPRRYEDRSHFRTISQLEPAEAVTLRGEILSVQLKRIRRLNLLEMVVGDDTGIVYCVWFNQPYLKKQFTAGRQIILFGRTDFYKNRLQINSPEYELIEEDEESVHTGRITPVYPLTEGLFQRSLRSALKEVVDVHLDKTIQDYLPESFRRFKHLMPLQEAVREMHFPSAFEKLEEARRRIVFDEFFIFQIILLQKMERLKTKYQAYAFAHGPETATEFQEKLPFKLTEGQSLAVKDLLEDLTGTIPMNRLLQGDVGSGKTLIALFGMLLAARNNLQAAMLVPTEILAEQHYRTIQQWGPFFGIQAELLTSSTPPAKRERLLADLKQGKVHLLVGTHALLQEDVVFNSLALVITDEQHKFGVHQRGQLLNRNPRPHQLVMTATPIPRTLAFTLYGDLSVSYLKDLPSGRQPIKTFWITRQKQKEVLLHILQKVKAGDQAYFVFPLIEETERSDLLAAEREYKKLKDGPFADLSVGLVHGRMTKEERDQIMKSFRRGEVQVLVATSVIEVGVDHPNATVMVIENAERFGLAQLHQMRGRIGRGEKPSECFLFGEPATEEGKRRLRIMTKTQNGFVIAEEDLKLRGPGDFLGTRQSGDPYFRIANPLTDEALLLDARQSAQQLVKERLLDVSSDWFGFKKYLQEIAIHY